MGPKREVPSSLQNLLKLDVQVTDKLCVTINKLYPLDKLSKAFKGLELSCHAIPWIALWMIYVWIAWNPSLFEMQVNFFLGLLVDLICVAIVKAYTRRRRPAKNKDDMFFTTGPDQFSFPSGHVSRAFYVTFFFSHLYPLGLCAQLILHVWSIAVSVSRVLMRRHYLLDVIGGTVLGFIESLFLTVIWLSPATCAWLVSYISDEQVEGPEYDV